jgi:hypothetical protein
LGADSFVSVNQARAWWFPYTKSTNYCCALEIKTNIFELSYINVGRSNSITDSVGGRGSKSSFFVVLWHLVLKYIGEFCIVL